MAQVELQLPPDVVHVSLARLVVCAAARQAGMAEDKVEDLRIAVSEAATNAIVAQRDSDDAERTTLRFGAEQDDDWFAVAVLGAGPGLERESPGHGDTLDLLAESGLGVVLIRGLADEVDVIGGDVAMRFKIGDAPVRGASL